MIVRVLVGLPGAGKTTKIRREMTGTKGRYLFATSRIELINERIKELRDDANAAGTEPLIVPIHGQCLKRGRRVPREIEEAAEKHRDCDHVIVCVTHEGLMAADMSGFHGWHGYLDEMMSAVTSDVFDVPATATYLEAAYDLDLAGKWPKLVLTPDAPSLRSIQKDEFLKGLATFDKRARSPQGVFVDIESWDDLKDSSRVLRCWSVWTPAELAAFESVTIAASGYMGSVAHRAALAFCPEITFVPEEVVGEARARPRVLIHYFTEGHRGSTSFWQKPEGRRCLGAVRHHLEGITSLGFWSGNEEVCDYLTGVMPGRMVSPRQEGTNTLRLLTSCAFIYSAKATPKDEPSIEMFGLMGEDIEHSRECEDIKQFVMRGALREAAFGGDYPIYLYDLHQARMLADYLEDNAIASVELVPVHEAGIMDAGRPPLHGKREKDDECSKAERAQRRRESDAARKARKRMAEREAKRLAGTLRSPGRPKMHDGVGTAT